MSPLPLSVLLCLASAVCYAAAAVLQERVAGTPSLRTALLRRGDWWASAVLNGAGGVLHVIALGFGPLTVVQPLGVLTLVFVLPMAAVTVRRRTTPAGRRGALLTAAGLAGLLLLTGEGGQSRPLTGGEQSGVAVGTAATVTVLVLLSRRARRPGARSVLLAGASGVCFGMASVFVKSVAEAWPSVPVTGELPALGVVALLAVAGLVTSQASYRGGGLTAPLATVTVVNPVAAAAVGIGLLHEGFRFGAAGVPAALAAGALTAWGLVVLTADGPPGRIPDPAPGVREDGPPLLTTG
ncbi:DMT family transporter [Streptomyces sp. NPDC001922]|uniref:DMT family transporter n=1 Tax=Streptomyces sp. NPDC001922 TaxID=3364624 RepID=UPI0036C40094